MTEKNSITLFLMTIKGYSVLENLIKNKMIDLIETIVIGRDKKVDNDHSVDIETLCKNNNISYTYKKNHRIISKYAIAVSWKWLIDQESAELIVIHDSLLPKYRGFSPLVNALKNGEKKVGVTAIFAEESYDTGDIIHQLEYQITYPCRINDLIEDVLVLYCDLVLHIFEKLIQGSELDRNRQDNSKASYSLWLDDKDYLIDWSCSSDEIKRFIDAVGTPYKGALSKLKGSPVRILEAETVEDVKIENRTHGKIIFKEGDFPVIVCGTGLIKLLKVIDEEKRSILPLKELRLRFGN